MFTPVRPLPACELPEEPAHGSSPHVFLDFTFLQTQKLWTCFWVRVLSSSLFISLILCSTPPPPPPPNPHLFLQAVGNNGFLLVNFAIMSTFTFVFFLSLSPNDPINVSALTSATGSAAVLQ